MYHLEREKEKGRMGGMEKGKEEGRKEGKKRGRNEGRKEEREEGRKEKTSLTFTVFFSHYPVTQTSFSAKSPQGFFSALVSLPPLPHRLYSLVKIKSLMTSGCSKMN
jgi:hypothetical protein